MQFVAQGIDIPDELIQAHEEGRVVFFCGAGISYESHLPDFKHLTENVFNRVGEERTSAEKEMFERQRYDAVIGSLEHRLAMPELVRKALWNDLTPDWDRTDNSLETHRALLALSKVGNNRDVIQLVTTNFDLIFEKLIAEQDVRCNRYVAPLLPTPRVGLWNGIVYLHGRLPMGNEDQSSPLMNLVVASGDYGRAYLSEAWAARFVNELLRNYVVCFVGYSMGDATVRYLADAVEVYKRSGNKTEPVYMFMDSTAQDVLTTNESIIAIRYDSNANGGNHAVLHQSLQAWASRYEAGVDGKFEIVRECAKIDPTTVPDDGYIGRMKWALSDKSNKPLEYFAMLPERPKFGWIKKLSGIGCFDADLFSRNGNRRAHLLAYLIVRHAENPDCLAWIIANQSRFFRGFDRYLENVCDGKIEERNETVKKSVPLRLSRFSERLVRLIIARKVADGSDAWLRKGLDFEHWVFNGDLDVLKLNRIVSEFEPAIKVQVTDPIFYSPYEDLQKLPNRKRFSVELTIAGRHANHIAKSIREKLKGNIWRFVERLSVAFEDILDAREYLLENGCEESVFAVQVPSIEDHSQNKPDYQELVSVMLLIREGWLELVDRDRTKARALALKWLASPHCAMKRFGLYAAKVSDVLSPIEWSSVFVENCGALLWLPTVKREMMRLFATKGAELAADQLDMLVDRIINGRPPCFSLSCLEGNQSDDIAIEHAKFVRLGKLKASGAKLPVRALSEFDRLQSENPEWRIADDESDEFYVYSTITDFDDEISAISPQVKDSVPRNEEQLVDWMSHDKVVTDRWWRRRDGFCELCNESPSIVKNAIKRAVAGGVINVSRIVEALNEWSDSKTLQIGIELVVNVVSKITQPFRDEIVKQLGRWGEAVVKSGTASSEDLKNISRLFMEADYGKEFNGFHVHGKKDLISPAINHPLGRFTTELIESCFPETIRKGVGISEPYKSIFTDILCLRSESAWNARLVLASRAIAFYYADEDWTRRYLFPYADWDSDPIEVTAFWQGYLWQRSLHIPILVDLKAQFIATFDHLGELGGDGRSYISLLISIILRRLPEFPEEVTKPLIRAMTVCQLQVAATVIEDYMNHCSKAEEDVNETWKRKVWPFLHDIWPKDKERLSDETIRRLCMAALVAYDEFAKHIDEYWFIAKLHDLSYFLNVVAESKAVQSCPCEVLKMVDKVVENVGYEYYSLDEVLGALKMAKPDIEKDDRFVRLMKLVDDARGM